MHFGARARMILTHDVISPDSSLEAWQNERFAPELLEHKTEVVDCILEQIKEMV